MYYLYILSIPKYLIYIDMIYLLYTFKMSNPGEPLAAQVRTNTGGLCGGFTPIQFVTVISE